MELGKVIKTFTSKRGNKVVFRYPRPEDLDDMLAFINELIREDTYIEMSGQELTREEEQTFLDELLREMACNKRIFVVVEVNGSYAGSGEVRRQNYRKKHVGVVGISLVVAIRQEGIGKELLQTLISEAKTLGLLQLELNVFEHNERAIRAYKSVGFRHAGMIPQAILYKGEYIGEMKMYLPLA